MAKAVTTKSPLAIIDAKIASIKTRGLQLRKDCHETLVMIMDHYIEHGDFTRLPMLTDAIKSALGSSLSQAANQWVSEFVPSLKWEKTVGAFEHVKGVKKEIRDLENYKVTAKGDGPANVFTGNARDLPFYELERVAKQEPFDLQKAILSLVGRAEREYEKAIKEHTEAPVNSAQIAALKSLGEHIAEYKPEDGKAEETQSEEQVEAVKAA
jgi:hypothetical protein